MAASLMIWMNEVQKYLCLKIAVIQSTSEIYGPFLKNDFEGWIFGKAAVPRRWGCLVAKGTVRFDSMAVSIFVDILVELTNTASEAKIQTTPLIVRGGASSMYDGRWESTCSR